MNEHNKMNKKPLEDSDTIVYNILKGENNINKQSTTNLANTRKQEEYGATTSSNLVQNDLNVTKSAVQSCKSVKFYQTQTQISQQNIDINPKPNQNISSVESIALDVIDQTKIIDNNTNSIEEITRNIINSSKSSLEQKKNKSSLHLATTQNASLQENCCEPETVGDDTRRKSQNHIFCECDTTSCAGAAVPIVVSFVASEAPIKTSNGQLCPMKLDGAADKDSTDSHTEVNQLPNETSTDTIAHENSEFHLLQNEVASWESLKYQNKVSASAISSPLRNEILTKEIVEVPSLASEFKQAKHINISKASLNSLKAYALPCYSISRHHLETQILDKDIEETSLPLDYVDTKPEVESWKLQKKEAEVSLSRETTNETASHNLSELNKEVHECSISTSITKEVHNKNHYVQGTSEMMKQVSHIDTSEEERNEGSSSNKPSMIPKLVLRPRRSSSERAKGFGEDIKGTNSNSSEISHIPLPKNAPAPKKLKKCEFIEEPGRNEVLMSEFYNSVGEIKKIAEVLSRKDSSISQIEAIENLYSYVLKIRNIASMLDVNENEAKCSKNISEPNLTSNHDEGRLNKDRQDNKISIKVLPSRINSKKKGSSKVKEIQTELAMSSSADIKQLESSTYLAEQVVSDENNPKRTDSMDGIFIPSEPPNNMDDEEEDGEGLDITITFKELKSAVNDADSHLSICFSDLSAEALGKLKRCPKNFTLRMDFISGQMMFQSGKAPASRFMLGEDVTDGVIDTKASDMISLKPSTDCQFTSQLLPVENANKKSSMKILKTVDPEVFSVVSLPYVEQKPSLATRSCITLKSNLVLSKRVLFEKANSYSSIPQIGNISAKPSKNMGINKI